MEPEKDLHQGERVSVQTSNVQIEVPIHITEDVMPGTVSLPHGWGHNLPGTNLRVARQHAGFNVILTDEEVIEKISGNAVLNGLPVVIEKVKDIQSVSSASNAEQNIIQTQGEIF